MLRVFSLKARVVLGVRRRRNSRLVMFRVRHRDRIMPGLASLIERLLDVTGWDSM